MWWKYTVFLQSWKLNFLYRLGTEVSMYSKRPTTGHLDTGFLNLILYFFYFLSLNLPSSKRREIVPKFQVYYQKVNVVGPRASLDVAEKRNLSSLPEFKSLTVQAVATHYTDWSNRAPFIRIGNITLFLSHIYTRKAKFKRNVFSVS
jgi:hypothetical protein